jgi:hypothetical protein
VDRAAPPICTLETGRKFVPVTVTVVAVVVPTGTELGLSVIDPGTGLSTASVVAVELPPPGAGLTTVTDRLLAVAWSTTVNWKRSDVALTKVVVRAVPPTCTTESDKKLVPDTVIFEAADPTEKLAGAICVIDGSGLLTTKLAVEVPLVAPLTTVTASVAPVVSCSVGTTAVTCVLLTNVVASDTPPTWIIVEPVNPLPLTVSVVVVLPVITEDGETELTVNAGTG